MWGQDLRASHNSYKPSIIPMRVGTRLRKKLVRKKLKDHPHACGDKLSPEKAASSVLGSSPRVWGQVADLSDKIDRDRIIPTRMGTSQKKLYKGGLTKDHPHACGDKL